MWKVFSGGGKSVRILPDEACNTETRPCNGVNEVSEHKRGKGSVLGPVSGSSGARSNTSPGINAKEYVSGVVLKS